MQNNIKQTERRSLSPARMMVSAFMLFAVLGVMAPAAIIDPVPTNLTFTATYSYTNAIPAQTFALIVPADVSATAYVLATTNSWIVSVTNSDGNVSGTVPAGGTNIITVTVVATNGTPVGSYNGKITAGAHWSDVTVTLNVQNRNALAVEGDFDGDKYADPYWPIKSDVFGIWTVWMTSVGYAKQGPFDFSVTGGEPVRAADFDGDGYADPVMVANGDWYIWMTSAGYARQGPFTMSVPDGDPVAADFDGDRYADPAMVDEAGNWYIWMTSAGYARQGPFTFAVAGGEHTLAADFDGDRYADPAMVDGSGNWYIWMTSAGYARQGPFTFAVAGDDPMPMAGDFDGDKYADPAMVVDNNWTIWFTSAGYRPQGPFPFVP